MFGCGVEQAAKPVQVGLIDRHGSLSYLEMKKCPQCKSVYTDDTLAFCLSDGTPLDREFSSEETLQLPNPIRTDSAFVVPTMSSAKPNYESAVTEINTSRSGASRIWILSTIGLLLLLIGGGLATVYFSGFGRTQQATDVKAPTPAPSATRETAPVIDSTSVKTPDATPSPRPTTAPTAAPSSGTYKVVNVAAHDVLYIRPAPGNLRSFVGKIPPGTTGLVITGGGIRAGKSIWYPVNYNGISGWVNGNFIRKE